MNNIKRRHTGTMLVGHIPTTLIKSEKLKEIRVDLADARLRDKKDEFINDLESAVDQGHTAPDALRIVLRHIVRNKDMDGVIDEILLANNLEARWDIVAQLFYDKYKEDVDDGLVWEEGGYELSELHTDTIYVSNSPYYTFVDNVKVFCLGHEFFTGGANYPVFCVACEGGSRLQFGHELGQLCRHCRQLDGEIPRPGTVREVYEVPVTFTFDGVFKIKADSEDQARLWALEHCGMTLKSVDCIHSTLPDDEVDWSFPVRAHKALRDEDGE